MKVRKNKSGAYCHYMVMQNGESVGLSLVLSLSKLVREAAMSWVDYIIDEFKGKGIKIDKKELIKKLKEVDEN